MPTFNDPADRVAVETLARLFPTRQIRGLDAVDLSGGAAKEREEETVAGLDLTPKDAEQQIQVLDKGVLTVLAPSDDEAAASDES